MSRTWLVLLALLAGYSVGNMPDHSVVWSAVKVVFTVAIATTMWVLLWRERQVYKRAAR